MSFYDPHSTDVMKKKSSATAALYSESLEEDFEEEEEEEEEAGVPESDMSEPAIPLLRHHPHPSPLRPPAAAEARKKPAAPKKAPAPAKKARSC